MILILKTGKEVVHNTMHTENLSIKTTDDILYNIFSMCNNNIDTVIVTKNYVDTYGIYNVLNALKILHSIEYFKVIYISYIDDKDIFLNELSKKIELYPINCKLDDFTYESCTKTLRKKFLLDESETNLNVLGNIYGLIDTYQKLTESNKSAFIESHYQDIYNILTYTLTLIGENEILNKEIEEADSRSNLYKTQYTKLLDKYLDTLEENDRLRQLINKWQTSFDNLVDEVRNINTHYNLRTNLTNKGNTIILYFNELEEINFVKYFNYLYELLSLSGIYCKSLILDERNHIDYSRFGYTRIPDKISNKDLVMINKMVRNSDCKELLKLLTSETFKCEILLVLDKTRHSLPVIDNAYVFYLGNYNTYNMAYITEENFISPYEGRWCDIQPVLTPIAQPHSVTHFNLICNNLPLTKYVKSITAGNVKEDEYNLFDFNLEVKKFEI